jgi:hypothetical protein
MSECDNPSEETIFNTTCPKDHYECKPIIEEKFEGRNPTDEDLRFEKVIHVTIIQGSYNGSSLSGAEKRATVRKERKNRSHEHFKKEIFPTIPKPEQRFFEKKWKQQGK